MKINAISFNLLPNRPNNLYNHNHRKEIAKQDQFYTSQPSFKGKEIDAFKDLSDNVVKKCIENETNLKEILLDPKTRKKYFEVLGSLLITAAASITKIISPDKASQQDNVIQTKINPMSSHNDKVVYEIARDLDTKVKNAKEEATIQIEKTRGRKTAQEIRFLTFIENGNNLAINDKNMLIELHNKYCAFNRNNSQEIGGEVVYNRDICEQLLNELESLDLNDSNNSINKIYEKYINYNLDKTNTNKPIVQTKIELSSFDRNQNKIHELLSKYENINQQYKQCLQIDFNNQYKNILDQLFIDIKSLDDKNIVSRALSKLNKKYSTQLLDIATINKHLRNNEKRDFYINIANNTLSQEGIVAWNNKLYQTNLSFNKFNNLYGVGIQDYNALRTISEMLLEDKSIKDFDITKDVDSHINIELKLPSSISIPESFKIITKFYTAALGKNITLKAKEDPKNITTSSILNEFKSDYNRNNKTEYPNIIKYLYGSKHEIQKISDFDKHMNGAKFDKLVQILNNPQRFDNKLFDLHSKLRFIERFVLNEKIDKKLEYAVIEKLAKFEKCIQGQLSKGISVKEYNQYNICAPKISFNINGKNSSITLDDKNKIHTIF